MIFSPVLVLIWLYGCHITQRLEQVIKIFPSVYALVVSMEILTFLCITVIVVKDQTEGVNTSFTGNLQYFFCNDTLTVLKLGSTKQHHKGRHYIALLVFDRAAMEANTGEAVLATGVRAPADFDFDVVVINEIRVFFIDHFFKLKRYTIAGRNTEVT